MAISICGEFRTTTIFAKNDDLLCYCHILSCTKKVSKK